MRRGEEATRRDGGTPANGRVVDGRARGLALRALLWTFLGLTLAVTGIGFAVGSTTQALVAAGGAAGYALLLLGGRFWGAGRIAGPATLWYFALAAAAMLAGRGIHDVTVVLLPAGIFMGVLLLGRAFLIPLVLGTVAIVAGVGSIPLLGGAGPATGRSGAADIAVMALLLLVAGVLTRLVVDSLIEVIDERRRAEAEVQLSRNQLEARNETLQTINDLASRMHRSLEVETIAGETVDALIRHSQPPMVAFYLLDGDGLSLRLIAAHGFTEEERAAGASLPLQGSLSGIAVHEQRLVSSDDLGHDPRADVAMRTALTDRGAGSALSIPLVFSGAPLGTVNLVFREQRAFSEIELESYRAIGQAVSLAIANARHVADLEHQAFHDALTDLPNRAGLPRRFKTLLARGGGRVALVLLDLNRFRQINEALGHACGDQLLIQIAARLHGRVAGLRGELFRLGGDEFAVALPGAGGAAAEAVAHDLLGALETPFSTAGMALAVGARAGVALCPDHGRDSHELLRCADVALYRAKQTAGAVASYVPELDHHTPERLALLSDLGKAIRGDGLVLHFQPFVSLSDGSVVGCEALVRWMHPTMGLLAPALFLPSAEGSEVVNPLTYWVVEHALRQLAQWSRLRPRLSMAINLSVQILLDRECSQRLAEIVRRVGVEPDRVEYELTETAILADPESALARLQEITATGARLVIDDFGTGYSSLSYLRRFPVHAIKIDRSFVSELAHGGQSLAIVRSTVELAHSLGLSVVAEGIEDRRTADVLRELGCELAQGFFFAAPAPAAEIGERLGMSLPPVV
jgi:diguanylate cyclase (GGDEF)-like protein